MSLHWGRYRVLLLLAVAIAATTCPAVADEPLHERIDRLIAAHVAKSEVTPAGRCDDAEFLRRVTLDLTGRIPSADETRRFLADESPHKRERLIGTLLESHDFPRRMADLFHVMLMERRGDDPEWRRFLATSFAQHKPWDQIAREILKPNPDDEDLRGAAFFHTKRLEKYGQNPTDYPGLTRDVGRLFLGIDLQCAQCHDHPHVADYEQVDFQGMYVVFLNTFIRRDTSFPAIGEKLLTKKLEYTSVFIGQPEETAPRAPFGMEVMIPLLSQEEQYLVPPDRKTRSPGVPRFSPMGVLAEKIPTAENDLFKQNITNRLWFVMMGRGIVDPLDLSHSGNPPSHPELLALLAAEFAAHNFDVKWLLRELALSETYQRSSLLPDVEHPPLPQSFAVALEKPLSAEQLFESMLQATGERDILLAEIDEQLRAADPKLFDILRAEPLRLWEARDERLAELKQAFITAFGNVPREPEVEFSPTVKASLFLMNEKTVLGWLERKPGNLIDRLAGLSDDRKLAEELYLSVLTRFPTDEERDEVSAYLARRGDDRDRALRNLAWSLLASTEFRLNH